MASFGGNCNTFIQLSFMCPHVVCGCGFYLLQLITDVASPCLTNFTSLSNCQTSKACFCYGKGCLNLYNPGCKLDGFIIALLDLLPVYI